MLVLHKGILIFFTPRQTLKKKCNPISDASFHSSSFGFDEVKEKLYKMIMSFRRDAAKLFSNECKT